MDGEDEVVGLGTQVATLDARLDEPGKQKTLEARRTRRTSS
jgi:hypothetical protein